jgi:hypothetical protein
VLDNHELLNFRPPAHIQLALKARTWPPGLWHVHRVEDGWGPVNYDQYDVSVSRMPHASSVMSGPVGGDPNRPATDVELAYFIRTNLNRFVDSRLASFEPYDAVPDGPLWAMPLPLGAVIHIDMRDPRGSTQFSENPDDGSVVVSSVSPRSWTFSTIFTVKDGAHPLSGNRIFGIDERAPGNWSWFTSGAVRPTGVVDAVVQSEIFGAAHALWTSHQQIVANFVNSNGGAATVGHSIAERHGWDELQARYFHPREAWI